MVQNTPFVTLASIYYTSDEMCKEAFLCGKLIFVRLVYGTPNTSLCFATFHNIWNGSIAYSALARIKT